MKNPSEGGSYLRHKDGTLERLLDGLPLKEGRRTFSDAVDTLLSEKRFSASEVFDRIKKSLGCDSDAELAWILGTSPQNISNRRKRNSVPYREALFLSAWANVSLDYLLIGEGEIRPLTK